MSQVAQG